MKTAPFLALSLAISPLARADVTAVVQGPNGTVRTSIFSEQNAMLPIAQVEDRVVTLQDLSDALAATHQAHGAMAETKKSLEGGKKDYTPVLDRLIGTRLIALEAREMGIADLPEINEEMAGFREASLREALKARLTRDTASDPAEVKAVYEEMAREWTVSSKFFAKEEDAKAFAASIKAGKKWEGGDVQVLSRKQHGLPGVMQAVQPLKAGEVSAPVPVDKGYALLRVDSIAYPEDPKARAEAEEWSLGRRQNTALMKAFRDYQQKYAKVDDKLLAKIDFEAKKPGLAALKKDKRVVAKIQGGSDILVSELTQSVVDEFFHSVEQAIKEKKVNAKKQPQFELLLYKRLFNAEAHRQGIDKSPEYVKSLSDHRDALVFAKFVEKAILPDIKITEGEAKKYYEDHKAEFTYPAFYTLSSIGFSTAKNAQAAMGKLRAGTDFKWLKANAPGLLSEKSRTIDFEGTTLSARGLGADLAKVLSGAKPGDVRLWSSAEGGHYVVVVKAVTPPTPQPYPEAREAIAPRLQKQKVNEAVEEWIGKLRKARAVKVYLTRIES